MNSYKANHTEQQPCKTSNSTFNLKLGAVKGKDGLSYDTWSFDTKDEAHADKKMNDLILKQGLDPARVKKEI